MTATTDTPITPYRPPLGVGTLLSDAFRIFFRHLGRIILIGGVGMLLALVPQVVVVLTVTGSDPFAILTAGGGVFYILFMLLQFVVSAIMAAMIARLAYDAQTGNRVTPLGYVGPAFRCALPLTLAMLIVAVLFVIGFIALVVPALLIWAIFSVIVPVAMIERKGLSSLGRSRALTKGYRWPIIGLTVLAFILVSVMSVVFGFVVAVIVALFPDPVVAFIVSLVIQVVTGAATYGFLILVVALIYTRLRKIKEGVAVENLATIFD